MHMLYWAFTLWIPLKRKHQIQTYTNETMKYLFEFEVCLKMEKKSFMSLSLIKKLKNEGFLNAKIQEKVSKLEKSPN